MDFDPFDQWYAAQITHTGLDGEENYKPGEWEFYTLSHDSGSAKEVREHRILPNEIDAWMDRRCGVMGHKDLGRKDVKNWWLPFAPERFRDIMRRLQLPIQYLHLRGSGGGQCGASSFYTFRDSQGDLSRISYVIRPAQGPSVKRSSFWAFAATWDAKSRRTTAILDGLSHSDSPNSKSQPTIQDFKDFLTASSPLLWHPLTLPEILLHMVIAQLNERIRVPAEEEYFRIERRTGIARVHVPDDEKNDNIWEWSLGVFEEATNTANKFNTTTAYLTRRFAFASQLTRRFLTFLDQLNDHQYSDAQVQKDIRAVYESRKERLTNRMFLLENYEHQVQCMGKRNENLVTVLYTVLSQIDSRTQVAIAQTNLSIAHAMRTDSIPMRTIAYVTLLFMPGAYVASIFGMNFFAFDSATRRIVVSDMFWEYWVINGLVTIAVLIVWWIWMRWEKARPVGTEVKGSWSSKRAEAERLPSKELLQTLQGLRARIRRQSDGLDTEMAERGVCRV